MADPVVSNLATGSSTTATTTVSFTAQAAGTLLLLQVASDDYKTGDPSGWTLAQSGQDFLGHYLWYKIASGSETSVAYTIGSAAASSYRATAATNVDPTPLGVTSSLHTHGGATSSTTAVTPTAGSRWMVVASFGAMHSGATSLSAPASLTNSYTLQASTFGGTPTEGIVMGYLTLDGGTATSTVTANWGTNSQLCSYGLLAAFKVAAGGAFTGTASQTSTATVAATGTMAASTGASRSTTATVTAAGVVAAVAAASLAVTATITAGGSLGGIGSGASQTATASITAAGVVSTSTGASLTATATRTAAGTVSASSGASVPAVATITASGVVNTSGAASGSYTVTITAAGSVSSAGGGTASLTETATITAAGITASSGQATRSVTATITAVGTVAWATGATLTATATATAAGSVGSVNPGDGTPVRSPSVTLTVPRHEVSLGVDESTRSPLTVTAEASRLTNPAGTATLTTTRTET